MKKSKAPRPMRVVAVADMHVGSRVGLANPARSPINDALAPVRVALFDVWEAAAHGPWHAPDALIVNGDVIEGQNRKGGGAGTWSTQLLEQADHAVGLLRMWDAKRVYVIRGSGYHVETNGLQVEEYVARQLRAEEYPGQESIDPELRDRSGWHWYLHLGGVTFHVSHHISVSKVFHYQSTPTARQMLQAKLNDMLRHHVSRYKTDIVLRGHSHYYNMVGFSGSTGLVMPCWKGLDDYMLSRGPLDISPDIGFLAWEIENGQARLQINLHKLNEIQAPPLTVL